MPERWGLYDELFRDVERLLDTKGAPRVVAWDLPRRSHKSHFMVSLACTILLHVPHVTIGLFTPSKKHDEFFLRDVAAKLTAWETPEFNFRTSENRLVVYFGSDDARTLSTNPEAPEYVLVDEAWFINEKHRESIQNSNGAFIIMIGTSSNAPGDTFVESMTKVRRWKYDGDYKEIV